MPWKKQLTTPEQVARELKVNLEDKTDNARLLVLGTEMADGYRMRMTLRSPEAVAGIIYNHAIKTGELNESLAFCEAMARISATASKLIHEAVLKRKLGN